MPKAHVGRPATNSPAGIGVTRAHTVPIGVPPAESPDADTPPVIRPATSDPKKVWAAYADKLGFNVTGLTKKQIVELVA